MINLFKRLKTGLLFMDARDVLVVYLMSVIFITSLFLVRWFDKGIFTKVYTAVVYPEQQKQPRPTPLTDIKDLPILVN